MSSDTLPPTAAVEDTATEAPATNQKAQRGLFSGDLGQLPVIATLIAIGAFFAIKTVSPDHPYGLFLTARNLSDLTGQIAYIMALALGSVFVLLLGEIDLSLAAVAYFTGTTMVVLSVRSHWSAIPALLAALVLGALIGLVNSFFTAILRIPSFIVTLAGSIFYAGLVLHILLPNTSIILNDPVLQAFGSDYLPSWAGWGFPALGLVAYAAYVISNQRARAARGLTVAPFWQPLLQVVVAAVVVLGVVAYFESYLGVPLSITIVMGAVALCWVLLRFTSYGRHVYAVGGNAEAARRAGINVTAIRVSVFALTSFFGAVGGILLASRTVSGSANVDSALLLEAIAAAVIGGVSLFGGRGSVWAVVLGSLVLGSLDNGLNLLNQTSDVRFMVEGAVLIFAVTIDAVLRRRAQVQGR